jgi:small subunit ribosomal protein S16
LSGLADGQASILRCNTAQDDSNTEKTKGYNMTMIRMPRMGRKKKPFYRIVVTDSRKRRDGGWIEAIGHYNPVSANKELTLDEERLNYWLSVGAQMSPTVKRLAGKK